MKEVPEITALVTFLTLKQGGRQRSPFATSDYRPHLVVNDSRQLSAVDESDDRKDSYWGVQFCGDGREMTPGRPHEIKLRLLYFPQIDYAELSAGTDFTIREGGKIVGHGRVIEASSGRAQR